MNILVVAPQYTSKSGGVRVLHYLAHLINLCGHNGYTNTNIINPRWKQKIWKGEAVDFTIYPEVWSDYVNDSKVVRWCLNAPGKIGGTKTFDPKEIVYCYSFAQFGEESKASTPNVVRELFLPLLEAKNYEGAMEKDLEGCCWIGKGEKSIGLPNEENLIPITREYPNDKEDLVALLKRSRNFYSFDNLTALSDEALLCGCNSLIVEGNNIRPHIQIEGRRYLMDEEQDKELVKKFIQELCEQL